MEALHEGGCACGSVRYRVKNAPFRTSACHCRNCQRRTGSAFGVGIYFKSEDFGVLHPLRHHGDVDRGVFSRRAHHWLPISPGVERFEKSSK